MLGLQRELSTAIAEQIRLPAFSRAHRRAGAAADAERRRLRPVSSWPELCEPAHAGDDASSDRLLPSARPRSIRTTRSPGQALRTRLFRELDQQRRASARGGGSGPRRSRECGSARQPEPRRGADALGAFSFHPRLGLARLREAAFRRAIALDSGHSVAHRYLGHLLSQTGRQDEARVGDESSARVSIPSISMNHAMSSQVAFQAARLSRRRSTTRGRPSSSTRSSGLATCRAGRHSSSWARTDAAFEALVNAARFSGGNSKPISLRGYLLAKVGRPHEARDVLKTLEEVSNDPVRPALCHGAGTRRPRRSGRGVRVARPGLRLRRDVHLMFLPVDAKWDPYRADPQFTALLARCGFMSTASSKSSVRSTPTPPPASGR